MTVEKEFKVLVEMISNEYPSLVEQWKRIEITIKIAKSHQHIVSLNSLNMQKKLVTTHMKIINSIRIKDLDNLKILVEKYKSVALDLMDCAEDGSKNLIDFNTGDINEQVYIELCNSLKSKVEQFDKYIEMIEIYKAYKKIKNLKNFKKKTKI